MATDVPMNVLIVDDEPDLRSTLGDFVAGLGMLVRTAGDVFEARGLLESATEPIDIVLTDLRLPDGSGLEILEAARGRNSGCLVAIITGFGSLDTAVSAIRAGAYDYLTKPFTLEEIGVLIRNMVFRLSLSRENTRLSLQLQELHQRMEHLNRRQSEAGNFEEEVRRQLTEAHHKLDRLMSLFPAGAGSA